VAIGHAKRVSQQNHWVAATDTFVQSIRVRVSVVIATSDRSRIVSNLFAGES